MTAGPFWAGVKVLAFLVLLAVLGIVGWHLFGAIGAVTGSGLLALTAITATPTKRAQAQAQEVAEKDAQKIADTPAPAVVANIGGQPAVDQRDADVDGSLARLEKDHPPGS